VAAPGILTWGGGGGQQEGSHWTWGGKKFLCIDIYVNTKVLPIFQGGQLGGKAFLRGGGICPPMPPCGAATGCDISHIG
jgi:hypothetical protein